MRPDDRDASCLWDMLQACREILDFVGDSKFENFSGDRKLVLAIERSLEIIGKTAGRVSESFQKAHHEIPWKTIQGMRDILAHEHGQVDIEIVYRTVSSEVPGLLRKLEKILP